MNIESICKKIIPQKAKKYDWRGGAMGKEGKKSEKEMIKKIKGGEKKEKESNVDDDIAAWEESGYIDYMSNQRDKGWKT